MYKPQLSPSLLSADCARLGEMAQLCVDSGADRLHFDVMDNHYVPNLTFGPFVLKALRKYGITIPIDAHLMTEPVDELIPAFADAGATSIIFHPEATKHMDRTLSLIKSFKMEAGLAFNPGTPLTYLEYVLDKVDVILIMSVNPGFGGQKFIPHMLEKISAVRAMFSQTDHTIRLEVDGGVNIENVANIIAQGANCVVAGNAIFGAPDPVAAIKNFKAILNTQYI